MAVVNKIIILLIFLAVTSCSPGHITTPELPDCFREEQSGLYIMSITVDESNCGSYPLLEVKIKDGIIYPAQDVGCGLESSVWDRAECSTITQFSCEDNSFRMFLEWKLISHVEDRRRISGNLYLTMEDIQAGSSCEGWYILNSRKVRDLELSEE